ncbi:MAG: phosphopyruvate hydratase, partial [Candidatus Saccharimonadales bacterium]
MEIASISARQILDSRGLPTVEAVIKLKSGAVGRASVPSGASTGAHEAHELRDGGQIYGGKSVLIAVANIEQLIAPALLGIDCSQQQKIDQI